MRERRQTGFEISWHYSPGQQMEPPQSFHFDNQIFVLLANVVHQDSGVSEELQEVLDDDKKDKVVDIDCRPGKHSSSVSERLWGMYENISTDPIYVEEISRETLETTAQIYLGMTFCPSSQDIVQFYHDLFLSTVPLETVLKTLARILYVSRERQLTMHYQIAKALFDKIYTMMNLHYKDIAVSTTGATQLKLYPDLKNYQPNQEIIDSKNEPVEKCIK